MAVFHSLLVTCALLLHHACAETRAWVNREGNLEYCDTEIFHAQCREGQVILMETAKYGRMAKGRCIDQEYGHLGCHADVLQLADRWCSGRRSCRIPVPNSMFKKASECPKDLTPYLEASFTCVSVDTAENQSCATSRFILPSSTSSGYLANYVTIETQKGSEKCPWVIESRPGQRINITLYDFAREGEGEGGGEYEVCRVLASITEADTDKRDNTVCGLSVGGREKVVYSSLSNQLHVSIMGGSAPDVSEYFMLRFEVLGCATPDDVPHMMKHMADEYTVVYGCPATAESWRQDCIHNQWQGELGNCTQLILPEVTSTVTSLSDMVFVTLTRSFEFSLLVVISVAIAIGIFILIVGILCVTRKKRPRPRRQQPMKPVQAVPPTSKATPTQGREYRKLGDIEIGHPCKDSDKLPPPPPELLKESMCIPNSGSNGSHDYERITAKMPSPPPSPTHSPHTDTTSISTLSNTGSLPNNKRTQSLSSSSTLNVRNSPSVGIIAQTRCHHSTNPRSPLSAGYNPRNSFEFPPPPPEALKNPNGYQPPTGSASSTMQKPRFEAPDYDILRYRIVDPKYDPHARYGSLGNRGNMGQNCKQHEKKPQERVHFENDPESNVPYEYGYHLKTGQKFKIYQPPPQTGKASPKTMSRDERNRKMPSATSATPSSNKKTPSRQAKSNTGTM